MESERRQEADDALRNAACHDNEVGVRRLGRIGEGVETPVELSQRALVAERVSVRGWIPSLTASEVRSTPPPRRKAAFSLSDSFRRFFMRFSIMPSLIHKCSGIYYTCAA